MNRPLCIIDAETTGLNDRLHRVWDLTILRREPAGAESVVNWLIRLPTGHSRHADPKALEIGRFHERYSRAPAANLSDERNVASACMRLLVGATVASCNIDFDLRFLRAMLDRQDMLSPGRLYPWHYSPVDVKSLACGVLGIDPAGLAGGTDTLLKAFNIDVPAEERHTSLGDVRAGAALYDAALAHARRTRPVSI